ncbi:MAG TPA: glycoside hydrolase family 43 protein, partial [Anseongella sp.]|nr:glycoside hydrolase family 43 protein [Anseongella sp.]
TMGDRIVLWKTANLKKLRNAERTVVFKPPAGTPYSRGIWAPELHQINGRWYIYFAADDGKNENHRLYVLENASEDPMKGVWQFRGRVAGMDDRWAIDGNVFGYAGQLYMVWSGWEGEKNGQQNLYIARMKDPLTLASQRVKISEPLLDWERHGDLNDPDNPPHVAVNEGPQFLRYGDRIFVVYSASGCWTEYYGLGLLQSRAGKDLLDPASWTKNPQPVFSASPENGVYAPGHNSFFCSPDSTEYWIVYHANAAPGQGCGRMRSPRAQRFVWRDSLPYLGAPLKAARAKGPKKGTRP